MSNGKRDLKPIWIEYLGQRFANEEARGMKSVRITCGELMDMAGMPTDVAPSCGNAMKGQMRAGDSIIDEPPCGYGRRLEIEYLLPR